ncbi:gamma-glutamyl phosphate reductase [Vararia minispora EC-137]|uniref:Gamma-glutamyl phosphate reductase n=1 Tax=Vararia minispora EC-137 TaxID=1314806 RepID=A0ACB8QUG8_9AGAM|nr:gamma-glutamyl phosphate reductase [Vararia minispora EC-137]
MSAETIAKQAKAAFQASQLVEASERVRALYEIGRTLALNRDAILAANREDLSAGQVEVDAGRMPAALLKRLDLTRTDKWDAMLAGVRQIAELPDPNGTISYASKLDDGLQLYRVSCPIGVLLVIFEARPEVVVNIAALAIKSGNVAILKGGKESARTTQIISDAIQTALAHTLLPVTYIQTIQTRAEVSSLLALDQYIDLVIPRGSNELVRNIKNSTRIPVMGHADGLCNVYLDEYVDPQKAVRIVVDSKIDYPAACNAVESLLVHESLLPTVWPTVAQALLEKSVLLLCDDRALSALTNISTSTPNFSTLVQPAPPDAYTTEHLSLTLSVLTVPCLTAAIKHINSFSSHHTDCIVTEDPKAAQTFVRGVDSAGTYINASTRFADGFRYGFGAEVGIATGRIHARGPVGLEGLCTYKYVLKGQGHIVSEFGEGEGKKKYRHEALPKDALPL